MIVLSFHATRKCRRLSITLHLILTCANDMHCGQCLADLMVNAMPRFCRFAGLSCQYFRQVLLCLGMITAVNPAVGQTFGQQPRPDNNFERCRSISEDAARLHCYGAEKSQPSNRQPTTASPATAGPWPLVRTPNPAGGR